MTRDNLIQAINDNCDAWSCPTYNCDLPEEEGNSGACCLKCAERQLAEYEEKIRADAIDELVLAIDQNLSYDICDGREAMDEIVLIAEQLKGKKND